MTKPHRVSITEAAYTAIIREAEFIARDSGFPSRGEAWADRVFDQIESLSTFPERNPVAEEDSVLARYTVRKLVFDSHLILYRIDDSKMLVHVLWCRHGSRLPRADDLPPDPPQT